MPADGPRIRDIAVAAGVSITTVSHALNGKGRVLPETRARIAHVAAELGYIANVHAQRFASGRHMTLAIQVSADGRSTLAYDSAYYVEVLNAASVAAFERGTRRCSRRRTSTCAPSSASPSTGRSSSTRPGAPLIDAMQARGAAVVTVGRVLEGRSGGWVDNDHTRTDRDDARPLLGHRLPPPGSDTGAPSRSYAADAVRAYDAWAVCHAVPGAPARARRSRSAAR